MSDFEKEILKTSKKYQKKNELLNLYIEYDIKTMSKDIKKYFDKYKENKENSKYNEDLAMWNKKFCKKIIKITEKLTLDEATFLTNYYISGKRERDIKEIMGINKDVLDKIKESCLIKTWYSLNSFNN